MKVYKAPFSAGSMGKNPGCKKGPEAIAKHMQKILLSEDGAVPSFEFIDVEVDNGNIEMSHANILNSVGEGLVLGGDHSITHPAFKAFEKKNPGAGLIVFDAHPDVQDDFRPPSHEDYLRVLIEEGLDPSKVILIGLRSWSKEEKQYLYEKKITQFHMHHMYHEGLMACCEALMEKIRSWPCAYLSIDIDVVDPSMAPGTGYCEPGGLSSREILAFIRRIRRLKQVKMIDIVEVNPELDINDMTVALAAKVAVELSYRP